MIYATAVLAHEIGLDETRRKTCARWAPRRASVLKAVHSTFGDGVANDFKPTIALGLLREP